MIYLLSKFKQLIAHLFSDTIRIQVPMENAIFVTAQAFSRLSVHAQKYNTAIMSVNEKMRTTIFQIATSKIKSILQR